MRNFRLGLFLAFAFLVVAGPILVYGAEPKGIVPCDGPGCRACDFIQLGQNIIDWFIKIAASVIALTFAWGGMKMVMSGGDTGAVSSARSMMTNSVIGLVILLGSWIIVNTILVLLVDEKNIGKWYEIKCTALPPSTTVPPAPPVIGTTGTLSHADALAQLAGVTVVSSGNCTDKNNENCTSLDGLQAQALTEISGTIKACTGCNLQITAGTEVGHTNSCHQGGTCVDIRCANGCTAEQVVQVNQSATSNGARVVYETLSCSDRDAARTQGLTAYCKSDSGYGHITGNHFSLYTQ